MAAIDTLVKVNIFQNTQAVPQASFSIPLIIGSTVTSWSTTDFVHGYTDAASMLDDGFTTSSPEYKYALELMEQDITPSQFFVGYRNVAVKQEDDVTPVAVNNHHYIVTIDNVPYDYLSDGSATVGEIVAGLLALVNADPNAPCVAAGSSVLALTAKEFGAGFTTSINADPNMSLSHPIANHGIADDLENIISKNNSWYGISLCSNVDYDIIQLSSAVEALKKIFIAASNDSDIPTAATDDILSVMKGESLKRSALVYSPGSYNKGVEAAWMGGQLPQTPGSNAWAYKTLAGIAADAIMDNARGIIIGNPVAQIDGKNGNIYSVVGGKAITQMGRMAGGQYIDITIGLDWLESTLQSNIYGALVAAAKIPYTDVGTGVLISAVKAAIDQGVANGLIDGNSPISITAASVLSVPQSQRANRVAPTIKFSCRLQGAFSAVNVEGTVSV